MIITNECVGKFINKKVGTDIEPIGKIIAVTDKTVTLRTVEAKLSKDYTPDIAIGGFLGNCANNDEQKYDYTIVENSDFEVMIKSVQPKLGYYISDEPRKFYDYNF